MKWRNRAGSANVEDRRGMGGGRALPIGGGIGTLILAAVVYFLGGDPSAVLNQSPAPSSGQTSGQTRPVDPRQDEAKQFVSVVLKDTEEVWSEQFRQIGREYREPTLVLFSGQVQSACGVAGAATGPFYCPNDEKLYIDLSFFNELNQRFGAPGDFAQAYVIAHEVGHHVQNQLGTLDQVQRLQSRVGKSQSNQLSVRLELQADYYAGVWGHYAARRGLLEEGDIEEGLNAAAAIGDDRLQQRSQGYAVPDSFTHGSSAQRVQWFRRGLQSGDLRGGDTFGGNLR